MRTIGARLILALVSIILAGALIDAFVIGPIALRYIDRFTSERSSQIALHTAGEIELFLSNLTIPLISLAQQLGDNPPDGIRNDILIERAVQEFPQFEYICLTDASGREAACSELSDSGGEDHSRDPAFLESIGGERYLSSPYFSPQGLPQITFSVPVVRWGRIVGVLISRINLRAMWDIVDGIRFGGTGYAYVVAQDGTLIAHPDKTLILKREDLSGRESVRRVLSGEAGRVYSADGVEVYTPIEGLGWGVVLHQSMGEAFALPRRLIRLSLIVSLAGVVAMSAVGAFVSRRISGPIRSLVRSVERFRRGELSHRVRVEGPDEIRVLSDTLNRMAEDLDDLYRNLDSKVRERTRELREANERLREFDRVKSDFLSAVSHELRTPLAIVKGYVGEIIEGDGDVRESLEIISQKTEYMISLVSDLLDLARIESGRFEVSMRSVEPLPLIREAMDAMGQMAREKGLKLWEDLPSNLPEISADPNRVDQVLTNLLTNAIRFTSPGGSITISARDAGGFVEFAVSDTGIGVRDEDRERIFDRFYRSDEPSPRRGEGLGLGLAISKEIVELHGGRIWVEGRQGGGSAFKFTLPTAQTPSGAPHISPVSEGVAAAPPHSKSARILLVDDDRLLVDLVGRMLRGRGYEVVTALDGIEALDRAFTVGDIDLILLDVMMPKLNGYRVCRILKGDDRTKHIPVIVFSAATQRRDLEEARASGADGVLPKPFRKGELIRKVGEALSGCARLDEREGSPPQPVKRDAGLDGILPPIRHDIRGIANKLGLIVRSSRRLVEDPESLEEVLRILGDASAKLEEIADRLQIEPP